ncbi:hypothetical protein ACERJO_19025 [Halalkalibacter sp. AB-rgal2]|uniref:hypothetical protein n=1 Tax=Halalkalibacter sp. AB-rgal2 TaxID=3242695 RepID=UPI00359D0319
MSIVTWHLKEARGRKGLRLTRVTLDNQKYEKDKIYTMIEILTDLEFDLKLFIAKQENFNRIKKRLVASSPYLSTELLNQIHDFHPETEKGLPSKSLSHLFSSEMEYFFTVTSDLK